MVAYHAPVLIAPFAKLSTQMEHFTYGTAKESGCDAAITDVVLSILLRSQGKYDPSGEIDRTCAIHSAIFNSSVFSFVYGDVIYYGFEGEKRGMPKFELPKDRLVGLNGSLCKVFSSRFAEVTANHYLSSGSDSTQNTCDLSNSSQRMKVFRGILKTDLAYQTLRSASLRKLGDVQKQIKSLKKEESALKLEFDAGSKALLADRLQAMIGNEEYDQLQAKALNNQLQSIGSEWTFDIFNGR